MKRSSVALISIMLVSSTLFFIGGDSGADAFQDSARAPSRNHLWSLDETSGGTAYDSIGDNHGSINGPAMNQTGVVGTSFWFDGLDDHVEVAHESTIDFLAFQDFSIYAWINTTENFGRIISKRQYPGDSTGYSMLIQNGKFGAYLDFGPSGLYIESAAIVADGMWHRVGMMRTGNTFEAYVDGFSIGSHGSASGSLNNTNPLLFGAEQDFWQYFTGYIDEISFTADFPPIADAGLDELVPQHTLVTFDGTGSSDDVGITNYWWNFTDVIPRSLTGQSPSYIFHNEGVFTVRLTVMDTLGQTGIANMVVNVTDGDPPVADAGPDEVVPPGNVKNFDGTGSYDPGHTGEPVINGIVNWTWEFDDGTGPVTLWGPNPSHQFDIPGTYPVLLTVRDNAPVVTGGPYEDTDTVNVVVLDAYGIDISAAAASGDWILMSFPNQISGDPLVIVEDILDIGGGYVQWDMIRGWDNVNKEWMASAKFWPSQLNTFAYVDNHMAFWLHITDFGDGIMTFAGNLSEPMDQEIIPLKAGWNLVGPHRALRVADGRHLDRGPRTWRRILGTHHPR